MALLDDLNINTSTMAVYSPLNQLSKKYLEQVILRSQVLAFKAGEVIFEKKHSLDFAYFLLAGKLKVSKNVFSSYSISSSSDEARHPVNGKVGDGITVKATQDGHLLLIDKLFLDRALGWSEAEAKKEELTFHQNSEKSSPSTPESTAEGFDEAWFDWVAHLLEFPLFFNLPPSNIEQIFKKFDRIDAASEEVIIREGEEGDYFYLLISGSARVLIGEDETRPIRIGSGSYFGEEALVSDTLRSATVIMNEAGVLARLDKVSFQSLLSDPLIKRITTTAYRQKKISESDKTFLVDIRSTDEFEHTPLPQCLHIPLAQLRDRIPELDKSAQYYISQEGGMRSEVAAHILYQNEIDAYVISD